MVKKIECCPNCFSVTGKINPCPYCGYDKFSGKNNSLALPLNMVLHERYIIGRILGAGGFGITYLSFDMKRKEICAIKEYVPINSALRNKDTITLSASSTENKDIYDHGKEKFLGEAETLKKLHDISDVVQIWNCFEENGTAYFVMEYIDGATLNKVRASQGGRLPYRTAYEIIIKAARCLDEIHKKGNIFHRDISPENIMVTRKGEVKVIDFGTAKYIHGKKSQSLTVVLKPGYAPYEQYSSTSKQGAFTDVYALASTFYYVITGQKLQAAPDRMGEGGKIVPLESYDFLGVEYRDLTKILDNALKINYRERTQTMGELIQQLEEYNNNWWRKKEVLPEQAEGKNSASSISVTVGPDEISGEDTEHDKSTEPISGVSGSQNMQIQVQEVKTYPYLEGRTGELRGSRYYIPINTMITVGRSKINNIVINVPVIGREHLDIFYDSYSRSFFVMDKNSVNHTYIDGKKCEAGKIYPANPGSLLSLARDACVFQLGVINE